MKQPVTWILVADGRQARVFEAVGSDKFEQRGSYEVESPPTRDIASDRPGRSFDRSGPGRHAVAAPTDSHDHAESVFLHGMADKLDIACYNKEFDKLVVVAPPKALGTLRSAFPKRLQAAVLREIAKDITGFDERSLRAYLKSQ